MLAHLFGLSARDVDDLWLDELNAYLKWAGEYQRANREGK